MSAASVSSRARYLAVVFQENYMRTANVILALFLTVTAGCGALAACDGRPG